MKTNKERNSYPERDGLAKKTKIERNSYPERLAKKTKKEIVTQNVLAGKENEQGKK